MWKNHLLDVLSSFESDFGRIYFLENDTSFFNVAHCGC